MPGGDRMGPAGMGPMTGRMAGYCAGYSVPGYMNLMAGPALRAGGAYRGVPATYPPPPYYAIPGPFGYRAGYLLGRRLGRGFGRGFGRGRGAGWRW